MFAPGCTMKLRELLPFDRFTLHSPMAPEEVRDRLFAVLERRACFRPSWKTDHRSLSYEGHVSLESFDINRIIRYRNSFLPVVKGRIRPASGGSVLHIRMHPARGALVFMGLWLGLTGAICLAGMVLLFTQFSDVRREGFSPAALIPYLLFAFGWILITAGYRMECRAPDNS